ncbi:hypothetical protein HDV00_011092 [Rhizophlyctis rosea]|nr:hypothetical protein HDV00_011092 [Rhizophlyctis rosea]
MAQHRVNPGLIIKDVVAQPVRGAKNVPIQRLWRGVVAECIATMFFTFVACASVTAPTILNVSDKAASFVAAGLAQGLAIVALVSICGGISGGHVNPAVTLSLVVMRSVSFLTGIYYITFQLVGGIMGAALFQGVTGMGAGGSLGYTLPSPKLENLGQAFLMEFIITSLLIFSVLGTAIHPGASVKPLAPIPIGFAVCVGVIIAGGVTGGSMNPARTLGPAVVSNTWDGIWVYFAGPLGAAIVVALLYKLIFLSVELTKEESDMLAQREDSTATLRDAPDLGAGVRYVSEARAIDAMASDMSLQHVLVDRDGGAGGSSRVQGVPARPDIASNRG